MASLRLTDRPLRDGNRWAETKEAAVGRGTSKFGQRWCFVAVCDFSDLESCYPASNGRGRPIVLKKSDGNVFGSFSEVLEVQPIDDRSLWPVLDSRVTDLSFPLGMGADFFNTIGQKQPSADSISYGDIV